MLDGNGWRAPAISARGIRDPADSAAWVVGIFVFMAIHDAGGGALCYGVRAGFDGCGIFRPAGWARSFRTRDGAAGLAVHRWIGNYFVRSAGNFAWRRGGDNDGRRMSARKFRSASSAVGVSRAGESLFCARTVAGAVFWRRFWNRL